MKILEEAHELADKVLPKPDPEKLREALKIADIHSVRLDDVRFIEVPGKGRARGIVTEIREYFDKDGRHRKDLTYKILNYL